jgi:hypothetical protein
VTDLSRTTNARLVGTPLPTERAPPPPPPDRTEPESADVDGLGTLAPALLLLFPFPPPLMPLRALVAGDGDWRTGTYGW